MQEREREIISEPVREREVVVERPVERPIVDDRPPRGGGGGVVAAIIGIALLLLIGWFLLNTLNIIGDAAEDGVDVNVPQEDIDVDVDG